jgi:glucose/mannose transport system substrate-binding protein
MASPSIAATGVRLAGATLTLCAACASDEGPSTRALGGAAGAPPASGPADGQAGDSSSRAGAVSGNTGGDSSAGSGGTATGGNATGGDATGASSPGGAGGELTGGTGGNPTAGSSGSPGTGGEASGGEAGSEGDAGAGQTPTQIEIFSWWNGGAEAEALAALIELHQQSYPGDQVINRAAEFPTRDEAREFLQQRMSLADPPDSFQALTGTELLQWVGAGGADGRLAPLTALAQTNGWDMPAVVREALSQDSELYAVPLSIVRTNTLFINTIVLAEQGLEPPTSFEQLEQLCRDLREASIPCLALGNVNTWTLPLLAFEMVLPALAGAAYYESFWSGSEAPDDPELVQALEAVLWLYCGDSPSDPCNPADGYFHPDVGRDNWTEGLDRLIAGEAAMAPMGDWAKAYLQGEGFTDFIAIPFPARTGLDTPYVLTTMGSVAGQATFASLTGSIPAMRVDLADPPAELDGLALQNIRELQQAEASASLVLGLSSLLPTDTLADRSSALRDSMQAGTTELIAGYLENSYDQLQ